MQAVPDHIARAALERTDASTLAEAILELLGTTERSCARCGTTFVLRRPHAIYCSKRCANASAQQAWRNRQKIHP